MTYTPTEAFRANTLHEKFSIAHDRLMENRRLLKTTSGWQWSRYMRQCKEWKRFIRKDILDMEELLLPYSPFVRQRLNS